jgi:hypothetical protein
MNDQQNIEKEQEFAGLTTAALAYGPGERMVLSGANGGAAAAVATDEQATPLFTPDEAKEFRVKWDTIQGGFVDEPRTAVKQADNLVAGAMKRLAEMFAEERAKLEGQWERDESVSTENLRLALRRYRSFFGRLLSV